jgi:transcriptional regulator with XRE-family HTH domain
MFTTEEEYYNMISVGELISIFSELSVTNKKRLYNFLINEFSKVKSEEYIEFVGLLRDLEEDLLYSDEIDEKEENEKLYFTQDDLAIMTGLSKRQVQRILKSNNIEPLNPGQKPLFYDLNEFEKYYFIAKNTFREQQVEDNSFVIEERKQLKVETLFNNTTNIKKEIGPLIDLNIIYDKNSFISEFKGREESENQQFAVRVG